MRKLKQLLQERGYTQEAFADLIGVSRESVKNWIRGKCRPNLKMLNKIADTLEIDAEELQDESDC